MRIEAEQAGICTLVNHLIQRYLAIKPVAPDSALPGMFPEPLCGVITIYHDAQERWTMVSADLMYALNAVPANCTVRCMELSPALAQAVAYELNVRSTQGQA